jgi:hypothetical protein
MKRLIAEQEEQEANGTAPEPQKKPVKKKYQ